MRIGVFIGITVAILCAVVIGLVLFSKTSPPRVNVDNLRFETLKINDEKLPPLQYYKARDGQNLGYRYYAGGGASLTLILLHGSAYHSRYLQPLASYLAKNHIANVYTPDLRGHGPETNSRGDVAYIGQIEDDLNDLVRNVRKQHSGAIILGGHSSGGGVIIRYAGGNNAPVDGYLLLAPYIHYDAPTMRSNSQWANPNVLRIIALNILNKIGITAFNHKNVITFNMPKAVRDGTETLYYSYALQASMHPRSDYTKDIVSIDAPSLLLLGAEDEVFKVQEFEPLFAQFSPKTQVQVIRNMSHFDVITKQVAHQMVSNWLQGLD